ncbi:MAG: glycoside hydrolase 43 family protein [Prevotellaceae bacterium]|jgi:arabinoxylan arabinofuranohydrolase|nr:glycoside hydrolase 43 family protein [Prevotellaceae bacterium]
MKKITLNVTAMLLKHLATLLTLLFWAAVANSATFTNPVIYADVPDPDVVRVGSDFYMVSTTMHLMPGAPIMKSKDLVSWEIIGYVFDEITDSPLYDLEGGNVYGQGQWASSLRYHRGKFYVFFATNRPQKSYLYAAENPAGKWEKVGEFDRSYHDASLLFDDDGSVYLASGSGNIRITELRSDLSGVKEDGLHTSIINGQEQGYAGLFEGTHLCKYNGKYYVFIIWWPRGGIRTQLCFRSSRIAGPYESKAILSDTLGLYGRGVAQGGVVDTEDGRWYGFLFQDHGAVGRVPVLLPCRWVDGWPMLGDENGRTPRVMEKPMQGYAVAPLLVSDGFDAPPLGLTWQWNHNPDNRLWSLTERPGYLRLRTGKVVGSIFEARNTLSQRAEGERCSGVVAMDVAHMRNGDVAGLGAFCAEPGLISVAMKNNQKSIVMTNRGEVKAQAPLTTDVVYLRTDCDFGTDRATFRYSLDQKSWTPLGTEFRMIYNLVHFMGNRIAIYCYATEAPGGYVDVDFFERR